MTASPTIRSLVSHDDWQAQGLKRFPPERPRALPTAMASLPTTAMSAANPSPAAGYLRTPAQSSYFSFTGLPWRFASGQSYYRSQSYSYSLGDIVGNGPVAIEFAWYGTALQINTFGNLAPFRVLADDQVVHAAAYVQTPANNGADYLYTVTFSSAGFRRIRIEAASSFAFAGVWIEPTASIFPHEQPAARMAVIGDSFAEGTGIVDQHRGFPYVASWMLGYGFPVVDGLGSTGYIEPGATPNHVFQDRAAEFLSAAGSAEVVVVSGGTNDYTRVSNSGNSTTLLQAAAILFLQTIRTALPQALIFALGAFVPRPSSRTTVGDTTSIAIRTALTNACAAVARCTYVDSYTTNDLWFTGGGNVSSPAGDGNADVFVTADNTHPTLAGHEFIGRRLAAAIRAAA